MIIDVFPFFNEFDLLVKRIHSGYDNVDLFIISDAEVTFTGNKKGRQLNVGDIPVAYRNKVRIVRVPDLSREEMLGYMESTPGMTNPYESFPHKHNGKPLVKLPEHFIREVFQRDYPIQFIRELKLANNTIVISGDLDEFHELSREHIKGLKLNDVIYCRMKWLVYHENISYGDPWIGTRISTLDTIYSRSIDLLVRDKENLHCYLESELIDSGRHISFLGGIEAIRAKLSAYNYQGSRLAPFWKLLDSIGNWRIRLFLAIGIDVLDPRRRLYRINDNS